MHSLHHQVATMGNIGALIPTMIQEVAPGDTWSGKVGLLVRLSPLKRALLTDLYVDQFSVYTPHRLVMADWEDFISDGPMDTPNVSIPTLTVPAADTKYESIFYPSDSANPVAYNALRLFAYNLTWNEFFRDDQQGLRLPTDEPLKLGVSVNFKKDYWTNMPFPIGKAQSEFFVDTDVGSGTEASAIDILRAITQQKISMKRATYGTKYIDILRSYGINVNYQMLQRPEVVAIARGTMNVTDVVSTESSDTLGALAGHGISGTRLTLRRKTFPEHGTLMNFVVVRPVMTDSLLGEHFDRVRDYTAYYDPGLVPLPAQKMTRIDVFPTAQASTTETMGYKPWGDWYRTAMSRVHVGLDDWVPGSQTFTPETSLTDALKRITQSAYDSLFNDTTYGHFQISAVNNVKALRQIPKRPTIPAA